MTNFNSTLKSTSKQGALSGIKDLHVQYSVQFNMTEAKWDNTYQVVWKFCSSAGAFMWGGRAYDYRGLINARKTEDIGYNAWRAITVEVNRRCKDTDEYNRIIASISE